MNTFLYFNINVIKCINLSLDNSDNINSIVKIRLNIGSKQIIQSKKISKSLDPDYNFKSVLLIENEQNNYDIKLLIDVID